MAIRAVSVTILLAFLSFLGPFAAVEKSASSPDVPAMDLLTPGEPTATATIHCVGILWPVDGDVDGSAGCAVRFRESGAAEWREALPLHRKAPVVVDIEKGTAGKRAIEFSGGLRRWDKHTVRYARERWEANYLAGSVFGLKPDTAYDVELRLTDADSGVSVARIVSVKTRPVPVLPVKGNEVPVTAAGGAKALAATLDAAKPGDIIKVGAGTYQGPFRIAASGTAEAPVVIRSAGDGPAVIKGKGYVKDGETVCLQIDGSHIFVDGLQFDDAVTAVNIGPGRFTDPDEFARLRASGGVLSDVVITRCKTTRTQYAIIGTADECYIADNDMTGLATDVPGIDWSEGEGVEIHGSGTVVCCNRMFHLADAVSVYDFTSNQDVYNNDAYDLSDDGIELDYSWENNRVWDNRFWYPANNGVSFQPTIGGPNYIIRNEVIGPHEGCSKDRYGSSDVYFFNNTFVGHRAYPQFGRNCELAPFDMPMSSWSRNNLYIYQEGAGDPSVDVHRQEAELCGINMDYDGLSGPVLISRKNGGKNIDPALYPGSRYVDTLGLSIPIDTFSKAAATLEHYTLIDPANLFAAVLPPYRDWREDGPKPVMLLKGGSNAIDGGTPLPTVTEGYLGDAPDLGAHESGAAETHYGPR